MPLICQNTKIANKIKTGYEITVSNNPDEIYNQDNITNNVYLTKDYLSAVKKSNPDLECLYITISEKDKLKLFASFQCVEVKLGNTIQIQTECPITREFFSFISSLSNKTPSRILVCGNIFVCGEHGFELFDNENDEELFNLLLNTIESKIKQKELPGQVKAILFKDYFESAGITDYITKNGYRIFPTEPAMIMEINPEWKDFQDYLTAMKTKYRTKAKKAMKESAELEIESVDALNISRYLPRLEELYANVESNASFSLGKMKLETYIDLKNKFSDDFIFRIYKLNQDVVGFMAAMRNGSYLDAHYVGIDYDYNRKHYIYQRMLYDYIDIAIDLKLSKVNFGRTAAEMKSTVGAVPASLVCFLKHRQTLQNSILKPITKMIKPTEEKIILPFK